MKKEKKKMKNENTKNVKLLKKLKRNKERTDEKKQLPEGRNYTKILKRKKILQSETRGKKIKKKIERINIKRKTEKNK